MLWKRICRKCADRRGGLNRLIAILLALIAALSISIALPFAASYRERASEFACMMARNKAQSMVAIETMFSDWDLSVQEAAAAVDQSKYRRDNLCPDGGDYFIVWMEQANRQYADTHYKVVCGLHDDDAQERTRLCSGLALSRLLKELESRRKRGDIAPDSVTVRLNGRPLVCRRTEGNPGLQFGTGSDIDQQGTVCYYALMGDEAYRAALEESEGVDFSGLREGEVWYFGYANPDCASVWTYGKSWSGDAWRVK